jgi:hypothetical protein
VFILCLLCVPVPLPLQVLKLSCVVLRFGAVPRETKRSGCTLQVGLLGNHLPNPNHPNQLHAPKWRVIPDQVQDDRLT